MLCFQGNQKGTFPRGLKQGEHAVAVVDNTTDKGCYSCNAVSAPKRHKERKKKTKTRSTIIETLHLWDHLTAGQSAPGEAARNQISARFDLAMQHPHSQPAPPQKQHLTSQASRRLPQGQSVVPGGVVHNLRFSL